MLLYLFSLFLRAQEVPVRCRTVALPVICPPNALLPPPEASKIDIRISSFVRLPSRVACGSFVRSLSFSISSFSPFYALRDITSSQLEVPFLVSLHGHSLVRSPQVARRRLSLGVHSRKYRGCRTPSLLAEEHIRSGNLGERIFDSIGRRRCGINA